MGALSILMVSFLIASGLSFFWVYFFWKQDKYEKEPIRQILIVFLFSAFLTFAVLIPEFIGEYLFPWRSEDGFTPTSLVNLFIYLVLFVGFIEELAKFIPVRFYIFKNKDFNEPMDGLVYASTAAMGFAFVENIFYIMSGFAHSTNEGIMMSIARIISSPIHIIFASYWGIELGLYKNHPERKGKVIKGFLIATLLHGLYDFFAYTGIIWGLLAIVVASVILIRKKMKFLLRVSPFNKSNYLMECLHCGEKIKVNSLYCPNCSELTDWKEKSSNNRYFCGNCKNRIYIKNDYCKDCGKKIIWGLK